MNISNKDSTSFFTIHTIFLLIASIIFVTFVIPGIIHVKAQSDSTNLLNNTLFVTGTATTNSKTDKVTVLLGVETTDKTAEKALLSNSDLMNKVINTLKDSGLQENETSTSSFTINPNYNYSEYGSKGNLTGFTVSNSIQITSSNIDLVSQWIDQAIQTGANTVNEVYFSISPAKLEEIKNNLLKDAVANAKSKAEVVATAVGLKLIGIKSITIGELGLPPSPLPVPIYSKAATMEDVSSTPILTGQQEISTTVSIVYLLGK